METSKSHNSDQAQKFDVLKNNSEPESHGEELNLT